MDALFNADNDELLPRTYGDDFALEAVRLYAKCWNTLSVEPIEPLLADDVVYESQLILTPLVGKSVLVEYLKNKMATIAKAGPRSEVFAELGYCGGQAGQRVQLLTAEIGRPCVLFAQGDKEVPKLLVLLEITGQKIKRIDLCTQVPHPSSAERTGEYPR